MLGIAVCLLCLISLCFWSLGLCCFLVACLPLIICFVLVACVWLLLIASWGCLFRLILVVVSFVCLALVSCCSCFGMILFAFWFCGLLLVGLCLFGLRLFDLIVSCWFACVVWVC